MIKIVKYSEKSPEIHEISILDTSPFWDSSSLPKSVYMYTGFNSLTSKCIHVNQDTNNISSCFDDFLFRHTFNRTIRGKPSIFTPCLSNSPNGFKGMSRRLLTIWVNEIEILDTPRQGMKRYCLLRVNEIFKTIFPFSTYGSFPRRLWVVQVRL